MKMTANDRPHWTLHAPVGDDGAQPDATITDRSRRVALASATEHVVAELPRLQITSRADAELVVEGVIGRGGMGVVQVARQRALDREVAVKRPRPENELRSTSIASLLAEARIQGALDHPNIVPIYALGRDAEDLPALVMKRLVGVSWRALILDPHHPAWPKDANDQLAFHLEALMQVCNAVHFAHSRGVIHRDIKPGNVMIGAFGEVYLLDWGLAYRPDPDEAADPAIVGSPAYLAPEMLNGSGPHITSLTDVYLLGATLHEVLMGKVRHRGETVVEVLYDASESAPFDYPPTAPAELAALCNRATSGDPSARPESALAFRKAIAEFLEHRGSIALAEAAATRFMELCAKGDAAPVGISPAPERAAQIRRLYVEASFGFKQALLAWEGNQAARDGFEALWTWMIEYELLHRNVDAAAALLAEIEKPAAQIVARIEALRAELALEREELLRLRGVARDHDPLFLSRPRIYMFMGTGLLVITIVLVVQRLRPDGPSHEDMIITTGGILFALVAGLMARRKVVLSTQFNRKSAANVVLMLVAFGMGHVLAAIDGLPVTPVIAINMVAQAGIAGTLAIFVNWEFRPYWIVSITFVAAAWIIALWPHLALPMIALMAILIPLNNAILVWYRLRRQEKSSAP
jgi:tRNA A-37 threonylcarbamoyl transferase component Bud32